MINDFRPVRDKPKRIEPLEKPPEKSIHELAAEHEAAQEPFAPAEPAFQPPEEIAATEDLATDTETAPPQPTSQKSPRGFMSWNWPLSKK